MIKKILLSILLISLCKSTLADNQSYGTIIQIQSKQIRELKIRLLGLENSVEELKLIINKPDFTTHKTNHESINHFDEVITSNTPESVSASESDLFDDTSLQLGPKDKIDYDLALAALKDSNFILAETKFANFIKQYPSSDLQSNATFWYAETFYRRGVYNKAAINYLKSYKKYPRGDKAPDSLLKLSYSLASLNKNKEACSMLDKLELEFPKRPINSIKRAKDARTKFYCK